MCERARVCVLNGTWPDYMQRCETILLSKGWSTQKNYIFHNLLILMLIQTCMHLTISVEPTVPLLTTIFNSSLARVLILKHIHVLFMGLVSLN